MPAATEAAVTNNAMTTVAYLRDDFVIYVKNLTYCRDLRRNVSTIHPTMGACHSRLLDAYLETKIRFFEFFFALLLTL